MSAARATAWLGVVLAVAASAPSVASANDALEQARRYYDDAAFDAALGALVRAESAGGLERAETIELLALRALVHFALGDVVQVDADLRRLAAIDSGHRFGNDAPPDFQRRWEAIRTDELARLQPRRAVAPPAAAAPAPRAAAVPGDRDVDADGGGGGTAAWLLVGGAVAIVVAVVVLVLVATGGPSDDTQVAAPMRVAPAR